ncbi:dihydroorotase [Oxalobacter vibrioformis]|uniref:Dihydroorotase n=1 Tax=Oxalobacter vibrioformis TaxID=933080 RepID=A0A9E9M046_9BURK|nr:dihydroorotase [Oxalobacter vibrioformis]WAW10734.1 dihydroorotase [Oxalobacter vibrioformis]
MKLHIQNGRLIDPANGVDGEKEIFIADGNILAVTEPGQSRPDFTPDRIIDASGLIVSPGFVDLSARLREPGYEYKATLESEMNAAMHGGVTSLVCPPDTDPVLDEPGLVEMLKYRAKSLYQAHVYPLGALTVGLKGESLTEMAELRESGCIGFSQAAEPVRNTEMLMRALQYAKTYDYCVWLRPQDAWLGRSGIAHAGPVAARLGLSGVPSIAETIALYMLFELVRQTGVRLHLCRLSTAKGIELVREAKKEGLSITCDVGAHHVHLTEDNIDFFDSNARMLPPFRSREDRDAISLGLLDGTIDAICSDHTPVDDDEKMLPFGEATPGATGLELLLPLTLKWAEEHTANSPDALSRAIAKITSDPARILQLQCGQLTPDYVADICLFDPAVKWIVKPSAFASQGKHTPYEGKEVTGQVKMTIVEGRIAYESITG